MQMMVKHLHNFSEPMFFQVKHHKLRVFFNNVFPPKKTALGLPRERRARDDGGDECLLRLRIASEKAVAIGGFTYIYIYMYM